MNDYELITKVSMMIFLAVTIISGYCMYDCNPDFVKDKKKKIRTKKIATYSTISGISASLLSIFFMIYLI